MKEGAGVKLQRFSVFGQASVFVLAEMGHW